VDLVDLVVVDPTGQQQELLVDRQLDIQDHLNKDFLEEVDLVLMLAVAVVAALAVREEMVLLHLVDLVDWEDKYQQHLETQNHLHH
jgi:hypothetical protein